MSAAAFCAANAALAASINGESQLSLSHTWLINSGNTPAGLVINNLSNTLVIESDVTTVVADPTAIETRLQNFTVGNPFSDPVIPVQSFGMSRTTVPDSIDNATAIYNYTIESEDDPDPAFFDITRRDIEQVGFAAVNMNENPVESSAMSSHMGGRDFRFDNTTDETLSFNLTGLFSADLSARFTGADGFARTGAGFDLLFDVGRGSSVTFFPVALYLTTTMDSDLGTFVNDQYLTNSGGITGVSFGASVSAIGTGGETRASFLGESRYAFGITLDPNASLLMQTSFNQVNSVGVDPADPIASVPLPAGLPLLLSSLVGLGALRCKRSLPFKKFLSRNRKQAASGIHLNMAGI